MFFPSNIVLGVNFFLYKFLYLFYRILVISIFISLTNKTVKKIHLFCLMGFFPSKQNSYILTSYGLIIISYSLQSTINTSGHLGCHQSIVSILSGLLTVLNHCIKETLTRRLRSDLSVLAASSLQEGIKWLLRSQ